MKTFNYVSGLPEVVSLETVENENGRWYITPFGNTIPSVTTVLGYAKKEAIQEWRERVGADVANAISSKAAVRGTKLHNLCEKYLKNEKNIYEGVMPDLIQMFRMVRPVMERIDNIHYIEAPLFSESLGIAGRTDVIGEFDGKLSIIDFKTSLREKHESHITNYFEQETAYALMYEALTDTPIDQIVTIIASDNSPEPQVFIKNKENYIVGLLEKIIKFKKDHRNVS